MLVKCKYISIRHVFNQTPSELVSEGDLIHDLITQLRTQPTRLSNYMADMMPLKGHPNLHKYSSSATLGELMLQAFNHSNKKEVGAFSVSVIYKTSNMKQSFGDYYSKLFKSISPGFCTIDQNALLTQDMPNNVKQAYQQLSNQTECEYFYDPQEYSGRVRFTLLTDCSNKTLGVISKEQFVEGGVAAPGLELEVGELYSLYNKLVENDYLDSSGNILEKFVTKQSQLFALMGDYIPTEIISIIDKHVFNNKIHVNWHYHSHAQDIPEEELKKSLMSFEIANIKDQGHHFSGGITDKLDTDLAVIDRIDSLALLSTPSGFTFIDPTEALIPNKEYSKTVRKLLIRDNVINKLGTIGFKLRDIDAYNSKDRFHNGALVSDLSKALIADQDDNIIIEIIHRYLKTDEISQVSKNHLIKLMDKEKIWAFFLPNSFRELEAINKGLFPVFTSTERMEPINNRMERATGSGLFDMPVEDAVEFLKLTGIHFRERMRQLGNFRDVQWIEKDMVDKDKRTDIANRYRNLLNSESLDQAREISAEIEAIVSSLQKPE